MEGDADAEHAVIMAAAPRRVNPAARRRECQRGLPLCAIEASEPKGTQSWAATPAAVFDIGNRSPASGRGGAVRGPVSAGAATNESKKKGPTGVSTAWRVMLRGVVGPVVTVFGHPTAQRNGTFV